MITRLLFALILVLAYTTAEATSGVTVILADDMRADDLQHMPETQALLSSAVVFDAAFTPLPRCVPSRAALLSGRLPSTTGIQVNQDTPNFDPTDTIATRLQAAGYRTGIVGKYLNRPETARPPVGWTTFAPFVGQDDHGTEQARVLIEQSDAFRAGPTPYFLLVSPTHPHSPMRGPMECETEFSPAPHPKLQERWEQRLSALCGLDELVAHIVQTRLEDEYVVFTSDNGWILEPNRRKAELHIDASRIPLAVWGPNVKHGRRGEMVTLIDLSETVLHLARADRAGMEGQSFKALLKGGKRWTGILILEGTSWGK